MKMLCSVQLSKHRYKTQEGYLICRDCIIARTGKQTYLKSELFGTPSEQDDYIDVDRKPEEVFSEKTMASFEGKPLTIEHPNESVSPSNYKNLSVGHVYNVHRGKFEGQDVMFADINVYDAEAIDLIESGEMEELSCGYDCDITEGDNPEQINIRGNHVALCEQGRAGIARIQDHWGVKPIEVKDTVSRGTLIQEFGRYGEQYKIKKIDGNVMYCEEIITKKNTLFKRDKENVDWAVIKKADINDSQLIQSWDIILETTRGWHNILNSVYEHIQDQYGYSLEEIKKKAEEDKPMFQCIVLEYDNVGNTDIKKLSIGPFLTEEEAKEFYNKDLAPFIAKVKNDKEEEITVSYEKQVHKVADAINIYGQSDLLEKYVGRYIDIDFKDGTGCQGHLSVYYGPKVRYSLYDFDNHFKWNLSPADIRNIKSVKILEDKEEEYLGGVRDSFVPLYIISLDEEGWLDDNDRPTDDKNKARKFNSEEEANEYKKIYCKGKVVPLQEPITPRMHDSSFTKDPMTTKLINELLEGISHGDIEESWDSFTINFDDKQQMRRAARKLIKWFDLEMFEDDDIMYIALYDKYDQEHNSEWFEDSDNWKGYNLRKGRPAEDFKIYLRDRGLYFEPSENGGFIHFEVENADDDVDKEVKAIVEHYTKVGFFDDYSKKFYINAIKALNEKLDKLERNELLDSNQKDYENQKSKMRKTIKSQIGEYEKKINEL